MDHSGLTRSPTREYLYSGGQLLASLEGSTTRYHLNDHLSTRVLADTSGTAVAESGHYPFGESWYSSGSPGSLAKWKFTSYERDSESGNDFAMARYHVNRLGRFNSPDPIAGYVADPQSMNRYAYTRNDPINLADPSGLAWDDDPAWLVAFRNGSWGNSFDMIMALMGVRTSEFFGGRFGSLPGMYDGTAEGLAKYERTVGEAQARQLAEIAKGKYVNALTELIQNEDCARLLGGTDVAMLVLSRLRGISDVSSSAFTPRGERDRTTANRINSGAAAATIRLLFDRQGVWTQDPYRIFVGNWFNSQSFSAQLSVLIHEMMHAAWSGTPLTNIIDTTHPASFYWIQSHCGTEIPKPRPNS